MQVDIIMIVSQKNFLVKTNRRTNNSFQLTDAAGCEVEVGGLAAITAATDDVRPAGTLSAERRTVRLTGSCTVRIALAFCL